MGEDTSSMHPDLARHFLTFRLDDRLYGIAASEVAEVIRLPAVARIPQSPEGLMGLANLRGEIVPVASGRKLLGQASAISTEAGRAIVLNGVSTVAFAVDAIAELLTISSKEIENEDSQPPLPGEALSGRFLSPKGGHVKILDIKTLLAEAIVVEQRTQRHRPGQAVVGGTDSESTASQSTSAKLVSFSVSGQEYALPLESIQEIMSAPGAIASLPQNETLVLGVTNLRDQILPLLSLRGLLGFASAPHTSKEKVVVTSAKGHTFGLVVDEMRSIFPADEARIDPIPDVLAARTGGESRIAAIYRGRGDNRLVSILAPDQIFGDDVMQRLSATHQPAQMTETSSAATNETLQFVVFRLGDDEFALPIQSVEEVARAPETLSRMPNAPKFLDGVVNLRGEVLPVVDQRKRFDMAPKPSTAGSRLMVVRTERHLAGLIVDSVSEVLRTGADQIEATPRLAGQNAKLVTGAINLQREERIILVLDPAELLTQAERGLLEKFAKQRAPDRPRT